MFKYSVSVAALIALASTAPALATAAPAKIAVAPAPQQQAQQQPVTRAQVVKALEAQFKALDTNGDGYLSQAELAAAEVKGQQQRLAQIHAGFEAEFAKLDTNHDGQLSKAEFTAAEPQAPTTAPDVTTDFAQFDRNKDGKVTLDEYQAVMQSRFDAMDKQHKGVITDPSGASVTRADFTAKLASAFKLIDAGNHGYFTKSDLQAFELKVRQQRVAAARARMEAEFTKLDTNHDGQLSKAEFLAAAPQALAKPPNGADALAQLDTNKDGKVSLQEFEAPRLALFGKVDTNHDGVLEPAERKAAQGQPARAPQKK